MPAEVIVGDATVPGILNNGSTMTMDGYATFIWDQLAGRHNFDIRDVKDERAFDKSSSAHNEYFEITVDITPTGNSRTAAAAVCKLPPPLAGITLANCKIATTFSTSVSGSSFVAGAEQLFNGEYQYRGGGSITQTKEGEVKLTGLILRKYADSAQNTSLTTTVAG
jgi:hypothetical protein